MKTLFTEAMFFLIVGIIALSDGVRLTRGIDPKYVRDVLGPGNYIIFIGGGLIITGVIHFLLNYKRVTGKPEGRMSSGMSRNDPIMSRVVFLMIIVFAGYLAVLNTFGYILPTLLFLFLEFRLAGVKSYTMNLIITIITAGAFYIIFVKYCSIVFPRGLFGI